MCESCDPNWDFSTRVISLLIRICSFVFSHTLYFSYFVFFAPYIIKLFSFLSPLFLTTSLLSLAILTAFVHDNFCNSVVRKLKNCQSDEFHSFDDLGMYEILFGSSMMEESENPVEFLEEKVEELEEYVDLPVELEKLEKSEDFVARKVEEVNSISGRKSRIGEKRMENFQKIESEDFVGNKVEELNSISGEKSRIGEKRMENFQKIESEDFVANKKVEEVNSISGEKSRIGEKRMENFQRILDEFEKMASNVEEKKKPDPKPVKVVEKQKAESLSISNGSDATNCNKSNGAINGAKSHSQRIIYEERESESGERKSNLKAESSRALMAVNSYGSMRREKEWKRTLACKLFEERHNVDGGEGMDSLWEAYEIDSNKSQKIDSKKTKAKKVDFGFIENCEEDDEIEAPLCCLQALKLSTGKMNLGVGIPNLVKISKAIKGIGWLHSVTKHSKKVHNNNGDRY